MKKIFRSVIMIMTIISLSSILTGCGGGGGLENIYSSTGVSGDVSVKSMEFNSTNSAGEITVGVSAGNLPDNFTLDVTSFRLFSDNYDINVTSVSPSLLRFFSSGEKNATLRFTYVQKNSSINSGDIGLGDLKLSYEEIYTSTVTGSKSTKVVTLNQIDPSVSNSNIDYPGFVSSLSLVYVNTVYDNVTGFFKDRWSIHAVDKYATPIKEGITLSPTLINGYKYVGYASGQIVAGTYPKFIDATSPFVDIDTTSPNNDRLIILPQSTPIRIDKSYLGDWTIEKDVNQSTLMLSENYSGPSTDSLRYVIGGEKRVLADVVSLAHVEAVNGDYRADGNGTVLFDVVYDPMLVGHTLTLSAKAYNGEKRSGVAIRTNFRGQGYDATSEVINNDGNSHVVTLAISIKPTSQPLVGVRLTPESITFDSKECELDLVATGDILTDRNGQFSVVVNTSGNTAKAETCTVSWMTQNSSIYYEY